MKKIFLRKRNRILLGIYGAAALINVLAWSSGVFCDFMRRTVFFVMQYIQGHISSIFPFSVGEIMLILALFLLFVGVVLVPVIFIGNYLVKHGRLMSLNLRKLKRYYYILLWIGGIVSLIMSTNCFVLYHCSTFRENYLPAEEREYTIRELALVREHVITRLNELAPQMERDTSGYILYEKDMEPLAIQTMKNLGTQYPLLAGYYPNPKTFTFSGFFSQQYIMGYYFPFSMEANYNRVMYIANIPVTICHELSHVKGFIYEDDANFIGYLACISSEDAFFQYSGYLSVLNYLNTDLYHSLGDSREIYLTYIQSSPLVNTDNVFLTKEAWEEVESKAVLETETVRKASRTFLDTNQKLNGIEDGIASYGKVVERLLEYYDGILY